MEKIVSEILRIQRLYCTYYILLRYNSINLANDILATSNYSYSNVKTVSFEYLNYYGATTHYNLFSKSSGKWEGLKYIIKNKFHLQVFN